MKIKVRHLHTFRQITIGLIGQEKIFPVFFQTRFGIHTLGLRKPIDVLILDNDFRVVKMKQDLKPNQIFLWNPQHNNVVEFLREKLRKVRSD